MMYGLGLGLVRGVSPWPYGTGSEYGPGILYPMGNPIPNGPMILWSGMLKVRGRALVFDLEVFIIQ